MKATIVRVLWGLVLIAVGGLFLIDRFGYLSIDLQSPQQWSYISAGLSAAFFVSYFLAGVRKWGWLFPALIFAALAVILGLLLDNPRGTMIAIPILLSVGLPFYVGLLQDRRQWGLLIPAWVMTVITAILFIADSPNSDLIGAIVLYAIALPFIVVYLVNHKHSWALITGLVLAYIGIFPLLGPILPGESSGPVVMFILALPFFITYFALKKAWWALIPAGIFSSIGVVALLSILIPNNDYFMLAGLEFNVYTGVLLLGFAITFGVLWLRRASQPTAWANVPALGLLIASILSFLMWKTASNLVIAITLLVLGVVIIIGSVLNRRDPSKLTSGQL